MEPTTALMFVVVAAPIGLFVMALSCMFKTFQKEESGIVKSKQLLFLGLLLIPVLMSVPVMGTPINATNTTYSTTANRSLTVPVVCDQGEECLPQLFVTIPLNKTQFANMSSAEITNLKDYYLKTIDGYFEESIRTFKQNPTKPVSPMAYCDILSEPGCYGIKPPDPDQPLLIELNKTK
ncbi:hypothetical protein BH18THE1_BH18THE1_00870 [soil metagenome]